MKKAILLTLLIGIIGLGAHAQKFTYGVKVSGGIAYQQIENSEILSNGSIKTFNIKGVIQMPVKNNFWVEGGLGIVGKGGVFYEDALTTTVHLTYLELPVEIIRKFTFTNMGIFYLGAGGYISGGIGGNLNYETPGTKSTDKLKFGKDLDARRYDTGLDFSMGFEFRNHVTFNMGYKSGLNNIASIPQQDTGTSVVRNREFTIGLGYLVK